MKELTVAVVGAGGRGNAYSRYFQEFPKEGKVVAVSEIREDYLQKFGDEYGIPREMRFRDWGELAQKDRLADVAMICTPDRVHTDPAIALANKGYHLLLEKPMAATLSDCQAIADAVAYTGVICAVCHVMRYTNHARKIKEMIDAGTIGEIMNIQLLEQVGYWHQAHSFVRGNWRNEAGASAMLLQKCCHDLDWIYFFIDTPCTRISSFGSLLHFRKEAQPEGAADRCVKCPERIERNCPYSAVHYYCEVMKGREDRWPSASLTLDRTTEGIRKAVETGPYGRCVYACDNDVVDHQVLSMEFEGGATATHTMSAFTLKCCRMLRIQGTHGELLYDADTGIVHNDFLTRSSRSVQDSPGDTTADSGHGGGDFGVMRDFVAAVRENDPTRIDTDVPTSLASHKMVFAAEKSRLENTAVEMVGEFDMRGG